MVFIRISADGVTKVHSLTLLALWEVSNFQKKNDPRVLVTSGDSDVTGQAVTF